MLTLALAAGWIGGTRSAWAQSPGGSARDAAAAPADTAHQRAEQLAKAVQTLTAEANELDVLAEPKHRPVFKRPHPALQGWDSTMAPLVLKRMLGDFTHNPYRDVYIRWHLTWVLKQATQAQKRHMTDDLVTLIKMLPGKLKVKFHPERRYVPQKIASRYFQLIHTGRIMVGYPPFQHPVSAPESYKYMSAAEAARVKANIAEAKKLRSQFKTIVDRDATAFNQRLRRMRYICRSYRGELIYLLLQTGDPKAASLVVDEIDRQARQKSPIAFDLMAYMYLAAFDHVLDLYDARTLTALGHKLEATARATNDFIDDHNRKRNFADYAFHMVMMLERGSGLIQPAGG